MKDFLFLITFFHSLIGLQQSLAVVTTRRPSHKPTQHPTRRPSYKPTSANSKRPSCKPTSATPTIAPSSKPSRRPSFNPIVIDSSTASPITPLNSYDLSITTTLMFTNRKMRSLSKRNSVFKTSSADEILQQLKSPLVISALVEAMAVAASVHRSRVSIIGFSDNSIESLLIQHES